MDSDADSLLGTIETNFLSSNSRTDKDSMTLELAKLVAIANEVIGPNCWNHCVTRQDTDYIDITGGKYSAGVASFVKVVLKNGVYHEDVGYGAVEGVSSKGLAISKAREQSAVSGLKKALQCFGGTVANKINEYVLSINNPNCRTFRSPIKEDNMPPSEFLHINIESSGTPLSSKPISVKHSDISNNSKISPNSESLEEQARLERKRRQQQKQEEFRQQVLKQKRQNPSTTYRNENDWPVDDLLQSIPDKEEFLSTQELDLMVQSRTAGIPGRVPLISSPSSDLQTPGWTPVKAVNNSNSKIGLMHNKQTAGMRQMPLKVKK